MTSDTTAHVRLTTPVVFIIFNRPDTAKRVFEAIRQAKPEKLLVIADGARHDRPGEVERCAETRAIVEKIDWECEVLKNYSDINLGCKKRISSGLNWVFETVDEAIVLEDDCLPHPTFFRFCEKTLDMYRDRADIMMVCGSNILSQWHSDIQSFCFSHYSTSWGWATWKRAWQHYDIDMKLWPTAEGKKGVKKVLLNNQHYKKWEKIFDLAYSDQLDTWALRWLFSRWMNSGLCIIPAVNLITNIGFDARGTHTKNSQNALSQLPLYPMQFPLKEPPYGIASDREYADAFFKTMFKKRSLLRRVASKLKRLILRQWRY